MRRGTILVSLALAVVFATTAIAGAGSAEVSLGDQKAWAQWAFGDSGAPLLDPSNCGEVVDGAFFLTVAGPDPGTRRVQCEVAAGVPLLATPGGAIARAPTDGTTDNQLHKTLLSVYLAPLVLDSVRVKVDGVLLPRQPLVIPEPYDMPLEPGNLIQTVDPSVIGDSTRVDIGFFFNWIDGLDPGTHTIVTADKFQGLGRFRTIFEFTVTEY